MAPCGVTDGISGHIHTQVIKHTVKEVTAGADVFNETEHRDGFALLIFNCSEFCASVICLRGGI